MSEPRIEACQGKALAVLTVVFVVGVGSGVLGHWAAAKGGIGNHLTLTADPETVELFAIDQLRGDLDLSDEQVQSIQFILDQSIMKEADLMKQIRDERKTGGDEIRNVLTSEQRSLFDQRTQRLSSH